MPAAPEAFRLGVNYWPSDTAMEWLARYDPVVVRRDFVRIAAAGMNTVRVFLRWEDLQPTPTTIDAAALASAIDAADAATEAALDVIVTLFTGHMSGVNWIPSWATGGDDGDARFRVVSTGAVHSRARVLRNWHTDTEIIDAQALLADRVALRAQRAPCRLGAARMGGAREGAEPFTDGRRPWKALEILERAPMNPPA